MRTISNKVLSNFDDICAKYKHTRLEMLQKLKQHNLLNRNDAKHRFALRFVIMAKLNMIMEESESNFILKHQGSLCLSCGEPYTKKDIDGGRCLSCGTMIC